MSIFDRLLTQPIFNVLALIYNFLADFGIAIIILTILIRFLLWPLVKKQLHQTKLMRSIQPELKRIKQQAKGNRMLESQMMMELYREKGVKPFGSILVLVIQLPIFIAVFSVIQLFNMNLPAEDAPNYQQAVETRENREAKLKNLAYPGIDKLQRVKDTTNDPENFKPKLLGTIDLTKTASEYFPAVILTLLAALFQFYQGKQTMPSSDKKRKLRDMFREAAAGKEVDQAEMAAATTGKMIYFFPVMTFMIGLALPAAVMLYYATTSLVAIIQQHVLLNKDLDEMQKLASKPNLLKRVKKAREAEIVTMKPSQNKKSESNKTSPKSSGGPTVVRRIKAR
ncbi:YidC/Oxa1 family membrane protein insertase [Candidatus Saccharibacteria bacterium]|nr:YidC/Oxa1 family membrane protein insertase [Candidatus Saccharibacteria bacterium]